MPLLAYGEEDPTWQAVVAPRTLLRTLYTAIPGVPRPSCRRVAAGFREHCCGELGSHYLLLLGLAALSGDVVKSTNYILKQGYNGYCSRVGVRVMVQWNGEQWFFSRFGNGGF